MPRDPLLRKNALEIDAIFKRVTKGVGLSEGAYLCNSVQLEQGYDYIIIQEIV